MIQVSQKYQFYQSHFFLYYLVWICHGDVILVMIVLFNIVLFFYSVIRAGAGHRVVGSLWGVGWAGNSAFRPH